MQPLNNLSWKTLPPEIPALPNFDALPLATTNQSLERPLFWESRRPQAPQASAPTRVAAPVPMELLGIVSEGTQRVALLRPTQGTLPLLVHRMHQGESYNGMIIQRVDADSVTLSGSNGLQILKMVRGSAGQPKQALKTDADQTGVQQEKPAVPAELRSRFGSDELKKHIENLKRKAAEQANPPAPTQK